MTFVMPNGIEDGTSVDATEHEQNYVAISAFLNTEVVTRDGLVQMLAELGLSGDPATPNGAATKNYVDTIPCPAGAILPFAGTSAPSNWAFPIGQSLATASYAALFAAIGYTYGGSGSNFLLPDLGNRVLVGKGSDSMFNVLGETGGSTDAVAVNHAHADTFAIANNNETHVHGNTLGSSGFVVTGEFGPDGGPWALDLFDGGGAGPTFSRVDETNTQSDDTHKHTLNGSVTDLTGENGNNKNVQPYIAVNHIIRLY